MNETFVIDGLGGEKVLEGEIPVRGAKNDALKILAASFLFEDEVRIENVPNIRDIAAMLELVEALGGHVSRKDREVSIASNGADKTMFPRDIAKRMRASSALIGPVLARKGKVSFPHPGGCVIGARPIDLFVKSFEKMGATCTEDDEYYHFEAKDGKLVGADIFLDIASVGATEAVMMAGTLATGTTTIRNAAMEPEIGNLAAYLVEAGAKISGIGTPRLVIEGGNPLKASGATYHVLPDRIETSSFAVLAALAGKDVTITECDPTLVRAVLSLFDRIGVQFETTESTIRIRESHNFQAVNVKTHEYPGFPTDAQAPMVILLTQAEGESLVFETMFEGRLHYTEDLVRMGADILMLDPHRILVRGPKVLSGKELHGPDIRAGLAYVIAGIIAKKQSTIHNIDLIDRGYERVEERFKALGARIERVSA